MNPFLRVPSFQLNSSGNWVPNDVLEFAKSHGPKLGLKWQEIAEICEFHSIAHVNWALRLTGSKRISDKLSCLTDTKEMLLKCSEQNIFLPDEGNFSPLIEISLGRFFADLGQDKIVAADHFGGSPHPMNTAELLGPKLTSAGEFHATDKSIFISIYTDYHYFLVCQTDASRSIASPDQYFEGFFADKNTCDMWGVGDRNTFVST